MGSVILGVVVDHPGDKTVCRGARGGGVGAGPTSADTDRFRAGDPGLGQYLESHYDWLPVAAITGGRPDLRQGRRGLLTEPRSARAARARGKQEPAHG